MILGAILIILLVIAYIQQGPWRQWRENKNKVDNFLAGLNMDEVDRIEITSSNQTTALIKESDERWKVDGAKDFYVNETVISDLINALKQAAESEIEIVSTNKEKKSNFQTDLENGIRVVLKDGEEAAADFVVGKNANDYRRVYVSRPNDGSTYVLKTSLRNAVSRKDWRDRTIFSVDKEKINKIRFQYPTREFTIEKKDGKWEGILPYKFKVDEDKIKEVLDIMSNLSAVKIPEQKFEGTGLEKHLIIVEATGDGIDNVLMVGEGSREDKDESGMPLYYYAKRGDKDNIYLITRGQKEELEKRIRDLK